MIVLDIRPIAVFFERAYVGRVPILTDGYSGHAQDRNRRMCEQFLGACIQDTS